MKRILSILFLLVPVLLFSVTTNTTASGDWNSAGNWSSGVPTGSDDANVNHAMTINANIASTKGDYIINAPITDPTGGTAYTLSVAGTGSDQGNIDVKANATFEGALTINSLGTLTIRSGDTLVVGGAVFANGSTLVIETGGVLIINGDLTNNNNSNDINVDGRIIVNGNVTGGNGSTITGGGSIVATGTITTTGDGSIFGTTDDCTPGPCGQGTPPLPVTLSYFIAVNESNLVRFYWETVSELNNDFFTVERSGDLKEFDIVTTVKGAGNSRRKIKYEASDDNPFHGTAYYRLKQTDFDGEVSYSEVVSNARISGKGEIGISPNPGKTMVRIDLSGLEGRTMLKIGDTHGKVIMVIHLDDLKSDLDLSDLNAGIYMFHFYNETGDLIQTEKFLKN